MIKSYRNYHWNKFFAFFIVIIGFIAFLQLFNKNEVLSKSTDYDLKPIKYEIFRKVPPSTHKKWASEILTKSLPVGYVGKPYRANVVGVDYNAQNKLSMTISGLPPELKITSCSEYLKPQTTSPQIADDVIFGTRFGCTISGTPTTYGTFAVTVKLFDGQNTQATSNLTLIVK